MRSDIRGGGGGGGGSGSVNTTGCGGVPPPWSWRVGWRGVIISYFESWYITGLSQKQPLFPAMKTALTIGQAHAGPA